MCVSCVYLILKSNLKHKTNLCKHTIKVTNDHVVLCVFWSKIPAKILNHLFTALMRWCVWESLLSYFKGSGTLQIHRCQSIKAYFEVFKETQNTAELVTEYRPPLITRCHEFCTCNGASDQILNVKSQHIQSEDRVTGTIPDFLKQLRFLTNYEEEAAKKNVSVSCNNKFSAYVISPWQILTASTSWETTTACYTWCAN